MDDADRRRTMVETQLRPSNVSDQRVLDAFASVPRAPFLPPQLKSVAYSDEDILLADGRFLIEPLVVARLIEFAEPTPEKTALVVGCDTGYAAVIMARLAGTVFALAESERVPEIESRAASLDADNVLVVPTTDPQAGHAPNAPYDVIVLVGRVPAIAEPLIAQIAEGGRLTAVVGPPRAGRGTLLIRSHDHVGRREVFDAATPAMRVPATAPTFQF